MDERAFYNETTTGKSAELNCPHCHTVASYDLQWVLRRKKDKVPSQADERDRARFAKAQSYMVLSDDKVMCSNVRCRKRFDISGIKTMAFLSPQQEAELSSQPPARQGQKQGQQRQKPQSQRGKGGGQQNRRGNQQQGQRASQDDQRGRRQGQRPKKHQGPRGNRDDQRGNRDDQRGNRDDNPGNRDDNWGNRQEYWANPNESLAHHHGQRTGGPRRSQSGQQQGQKKGKKRRPQVYFPSDYVNYRP